MKSLAFGVVDNGSAGRLGRCEALIYPEVMLRKKQIGRALGAQGNLLPSLIRIKKKEMYTRLKENSALEQWLDCYAFFIFITRFGN